MNVAGEGDGGLHGGVGTALRAWETVGYGFVNYFGLQRFGSTSIPTHVIGKALLKHAWKEVRCAGRCGVHLPASSVALTLVFPGACCFPGCPRRWICCSRLSATRSLRSHVRRRCTTAQRSAGLVSLSLPVW